MSFEAGTKLGPYEIIAPIGAGGPATIRGAFQRELRRGLAVAQEAR
jgi:hypothetical protein